MSQQSENVRKLPQTTTMDIWDYWKKLLKSNFLGIIEGIVLALIGVFTPAYRILLLDLGSGALANWYLVLGFGGLAACILFVNRGIRRDRRRAQQNLPQSA